MSALPRRVKTLLTVLWAVFLCSGPAIWAWCLFSHWPPDYSDGPDPLVDYLDWVQTIAGFSAIGLVFWRWRRAILPATTWVLTYLLINSSVGYWVSDAGFLYYIYPRAAYVRSHCQPMDFAQDGKTYQLGMCNLSIDKTGQIDFDFVYDTSGDTGRFDKLNGTDRRVFVNTVRKYFNNDPNEAFEVTNFTSACYGGDFYQLGFDDGDSGGFEPVYGRVPADPKNPYPRMFW